MSLDIKESDWKRFREVHPAARERYAQRCLDQINYYLTDKTKTAEERFFEIEKATHEAVREWGKLFDDFRRSTAFLQIAWMKRLKLITDEEMARFSENLRERVEKLLKIGE
jgi:hypothetical protein